MVVIFPDSGLIYLLKQIVGTKLIYRLFTNDVQPGLDDLLGTYQEANFGGYMPADVPLASWTYQRVEGHVGTLQAPDVTFRNTLTTNVRVYGFFITDATGTILVAASRADNAPHTIAGGGTYTVTPLLGSYSGLSS